MIKLSKKNKNGFSLIEVIAATFVLAIGIMSVVGLMTKNIGNSIDSRDTIIASELAQEGIELVRNLRDNNFASGKKAFEANFPNVNKDNCRIDNESTDVVDCNNGGGGKKIYYSSSGFYDHDPSGKETKFQRKIGISYDTGNASNADQVKITSNVWWGGGSDAPSNCSVATKCIYVEDILTDWEN
jgi:prepilin-type N-terminal cleavage/methylation domain-containing protein